MLPNWFTSLNRLSLSLLPGWVITMVLSPSIRYTCVTKITETVCVSKGTVSTSSHKSIWSNTTYTWPFVLGIVKILFWHLKITQNKSLLYSFNILFNKTFLLHKCKKKKTIGQNVLNCQNNANITLLEGWHAPKPSPKDDRNPPQWIIWFDSQMLTDLL